VLFTGNGLDRSLTILQLEMTSVNAGAVCVPLNVLAPSIAAPAGNGARSAPSSHPQTPVRSAWRWRCSPRRVQRRWPAAGLRVKARSAV